MKKLIGCLLVSLVAATGLADDPKISVFAFWLQRTAKEKGWSLVRTAEEYDDLGVSGFDCNVDEKDQLAAPQNRKYTTLGLGAVPNEKIVKALAAKGYKGWFTLENPVGDTYNDAVRQTALLEAWLDCDD